MTDVRRRIMCFGDSLTWGWIPVVDGQPSERYDFSQRWTGVLAAELGEGHEIIEEGLNGRTVAGDPTDDRLAAAEYLPAALASHLPLDLVIIMLGTNDTKAFMHREPVDIGAAAAVLIGQVRHSTGGIGTRYPAPKILLVAPPPLVDIPHPWFATTWVGGREKTLALRDVYAALADFNKIDFFDAGSVVTTGGVDGVHFTAENNRDLGLALAEKVRAVLG
jgi:lysophospholipase L1-like esterase